MIFAVDFQDAVDYRTGVEAGTIEDTIEPFLKFPDLFDRKCLFCGSQEGFWNIGEYDLELFAPQYFAHRQGYVTQDHLQQFVCYDTKKCRERARERAMSNYFHNEKLKRSNFPWYKKLWSLYTT